MEGLLVLERQIISDDRGSFSRFYCNREFQGAQIKESFVQMNLSKTQKRGTIRGMHFQWPPKAEKKIVTCLRGEIFDVAIDLRRDSPDYLTVSTFLLSELNQKSLVIPQGFAHGFQTLCDDCDVFYMHTDYYSPDYEDGLNPFDEGLSIEWPLKCMEISDRDSSHASIKEMGFRGVLL